MSNKKERQTIKKAFKDGKVTPDEMREIAEVTKTDVDIPEVQGELPYEHKAMNIDRNTKRFIFICPKGNQHLVYECNVDHFRRTMMVDSNWEVKDG